MSVPIRLFLLLLLTAASCGELNVWFERQMLESVISQMLLLSAKNPLRPRCKPRGNADQLMRRLTADKFPIVAEGHLLSGLYFDSLSRSGIVLANNVSSFTVHWAAGSRDGLPPERVQYKFMSLKSYNESVLMQPQLSIPDEGFVPNTESSFQLRLQCSTRISGVAQFEIYAVFQWADRPERPALTMQHSFKKACLSAADLQELRYKCHCRKKCEQQIRRKRRRRRLRRKKKQPKQRRQDDAVDENGRKRANRRRQRQLGRNRQQHGDADDSKRRRRQRQRRRKRRRRLRQRRKRCQAECRRGCRAQPSDCRAAPGS